MGGDFSSDTRLTLTIMKPPSDLKYRKGGLVFQDLNDSAKLNETHILKNIVRTQLIF